MRLVAWKKFEVRNFKQIPFSHNENAAFCPRIRHPRMNLQNMYKNQTLFLVLWTTNSRNSESTPSSNNQNAAS